jgi:hypothetical protein
MRSKKKGRALVMTVAGVLVLSCGGQPDRGSGAPTDDAVAEGAAEGAGHPLGEPLNGGGPQG